MFAFTTLPELFVESFDSHSREGVLQFLSAEQSFSYSSSQVKSRVTNLALGLLSLGLKQGDSVGIMAPSCPDWIMLDFAIQIAGGISVPIFKKIAPQSFTHEVRDSGMKILFLGNQYEREKAHAHKNELKHIITFCYPGEHTEFEALLKAGEERAKQDPNEFEKCVNLVKASDIATIIYTSGSTGLPKGVKLSQANIVSQVYATSERFKFHPQSDVALSVLPLAHIFERMVAHFYIASQIPIHFIDDPKNIGLYIKQVRPTILTVVPRILEKVYLKMKQGVEKAHGLKKNYWKGGNTACRNAR